jgi:ankyrin repeat protein
MKKVVLLSMLNTVLVIAVTEIELRDLKKIKQPDINQADRYGWTALMCAAYNGNAAQVERLLASGAAVNAVDQLGKSACWYAARNGHCAIVKQLLEAGATVDQQPRYSEAIYELVKSRVATSACHAAMFKLIQEKKQKINAV